MIPFHVDTRGAAEFSFLAVQHFGLVLQNTLLWIILIRWSQYHMTFSKRFCDLFLVLWPVITSTGCSSQEDEGYSQLFFVNKIDKKTCLLITLIQYFAFLFHRVPIFKHSSGTLCHYNTYDSCTSPRKQDLVHTSKRIHLSVSGVFLV